ncbi:hypothetical protein Dacsa_0606 [Dactylococcopsis salina PCC 8305]|uniref:Uncharacterized protein n=1 Tax=Dactylococcopsis salina (strain PCC 8305) TaxID=13035 RepID=K9YSR2_DACS8|nr:hypothetical protein Dacsa_0606 [Dactylococcopsis salina PCC 8305]
MEGGLGGSNSIALNFQKEVTVKAPLMEGGLGGSKLINVLLTLQ